MGGGGGQIVRDNNDEYDDISHRNDGSVVRRGSTPNNRRWGTTCWSRIFNASIWVGRTSYANAKG